MQHNVRKLLIIQILIVLAVAAAFALSRGSWHALSALYGGSVLVLSTLLLYFRLRNTHAAGRSLSLDLYVGAAQRFIITLAGFALGMGVFKLEAVPQLLAFGLGYLSFVFGARQTP